MKVLVIFASALAFAAASVLRDQTQIQPHNAGNIGIVKGHDARPGQFPYQVELIMTTNISLKLCSGSLISHNWILTAAHCTWNVNTVKVNLGSIRLHDPLVERFVNKNAIIIHEHWDGNLKLNDISLIRIPYVEYNKLIQPVKLPSIQTHYPDYAGYESITSGWGDTLNASNPSPEILQYGKAKIMTNTDCSSAFKVYTAIRSSHICVSDAWAIPCAGDSGGPLVETTKWEQVGLSSFGSGCNRGYPSVFTRVTSYLGWIKRNTGLRL